MGVNLYQDKSAGAGRIGSAASPAPSDAARPIPRSYSSIEGNSLVSLADQNTVRC
jgi:hypothetical protein